MLVKETKTSTPEGKPRRHWELWSAEDKDTFFEALSEVGAIQLNVCIYNTMYVSVDDMVM